MLKRDFYDDSCADSILSSYDLEHTCPTWCRYSYLALSPRYPIAGPGFLREPKAHMPDMVSVWPESK